MNPLRNKKIKVVFGMPGCGVLKTQTGRFKEILSFSEGVEFLILSSGNTDILVNMGYLISWTIENPPDDYVNISVQESGNYIC